MKLVSVPYAIRLTDVVNSVILSEDEVSEFHDWLADPRDSLDFERVRKNNTIVRAYWSYGEEEGLNRLHACLQVNDVTLKFFEIEMLLHQLEEMWEDLSGVATVFVGGRF